MLPRANDGWVIMYCSNLFFYLHLVIDGDSNSNEAVSGLEVAKCSSRPTFKYKRSDNQVPVAEREEVIFVCRGV